MGAGNERIEWRFHVHGQCARTGAAVSVSIDAATDEEAQARAWDAVPELDVSEIERGEQVAPDFEVRPVRGGVLFKSVTDAAREHCLSLGLGCADPIYPAHYSGAAAELFRRQGLTVGGAA